jgi:hypothetical protein
VIRLAWGIDDAVAEYLSAKFPELTSDALFKPHISVGFVDEDGYLRGALALRLLNRFDGSLSIAIDDWRCFPPREVLTELFRKVFTGDRPLVRMSCTIARKNRKARRLVEHLGFKLEGVKRQGFDGRQHGCIYGMLASECPFL